jgi:hypothetical protein
VVGDCGVVGDPDDYITNLSGCICLTHSVYRFQHIQC